MKCALLVKDGCKFQKLIFLWTTVNDLVHNLIMNKACIWLRTITFATWIYQKKNVHNNKRRSILL